MYAIPRVFRSTFGLIAAPSLLLALALNTAHCAQAKPADPATGGLNDASRQRIVLPHLPMEADDSPEEAQRYFLKKRLAPGMSRYPTERLLKARDDARKLPLYSTRQHGLVRTPEKSLATQALTWTALGPGNVGGRTRVLRFDPGSATSIYAAGVAGGVWKSTDSGSSWTPLGDLMANMAVTALLIDPSNTNVLYAGTGEGYFNVDRVEGAGIFKSTDGGSNWSQLASTNNSNFFFVNDLAFNPGNSAIIYAATGNGLYRSIDSGASWSLMVNAANSHGCMKVVYRSDIDTAIASCGTFASTASSNGIWRSTSASTASPNWTHIVGPSTPAATQAVANMGRTSLAIAPTNQATIYALMSCSPSAANQCGTGNVFQDGLLAVYSSTDGGGTWSPTYSSTFNGNTLADLLLTNPAAQMCNLQSGFNQGWYDNTIAVDPTSASRVFVSGIEAFRSDDGGVSWGTIAYWWLGGFAQYEHADHHGIIFHPGYDGVAEKRVYDINDGGIFVSSDAASATRATAMTNVCPSLVSQLRGASWTNLNNGYGVTQFYHGTVYPSGTQYFAGAQDNGTSSGTDGSPNAWNTIISGDGGWTAIDNTTSGSATVLYGENTEISIQKSIDNGSHFSSAISGIGNTKCGQFINPFQMDPNNSQHLFTSNNQLWRTSDGAASWTAASDVIAGTTCASNGERFANFAIAPGNSDLLVAGTDNGRICRLTNATSSTGATALSNCTQPAGAGTFVSEIAFDPNPVASVYTVYAAISTFGVGHVWKSIDSGQTWSNISGSGANALPDSPTHSVAVSPLDANNIYVGTEIGVFVTLDGGANWARENTGFANVITDHLVFSPTGATGQTLYAFTHGRGVFRTAVSANVASSTLLVSAPDPSVFGQSVTLTATVTGVSGTATGSVNFFDGATSLASNMLDGTGVATFSTSAFSVGTHSNLSAVYSGDGTYAGSTGNDTQTVSKASTTVSIGSDTPDPSVVGQSVSVGASVAVTSPGSGAPTGTITVTGTNTTGSCNITLGTTTSCNLVFTTAGPQTINATYNGDGNFNSSTTAASTAHTVNKASTTVLIGSDNPDPSVVGQSVSVGASVAVTSPGSGVPTGTITVTGSNTTGSCNITLGTTTSCNLVFTATGPQTINATYNGDGNFNSSSTAASTAHTVNKASTSVLISSDHPDPSVVGQGVSVSASVAVTAPGSGVPTGTITVTGSNTTGSCNITLGTGTACNLVFTAEGPQTINATYNGDSHFNSSIAASAAHTVNKASTTLSISDSPDPTAIGAAVTITPTLAVTSPGAGTPTGTITVTGTNTTGCSIALPSTSCQLTFSIDGAQTIDASYGGDANFAGSAATQIGHTVTPTVDLAVTNSDGMTLAPIGTLVTYSIVVSNAGPSTATGATLTDVAATLANVTWTCAAAAPAVCPHSSGVGPINEIITLASGQSLTYQLSGNVTIATGKTQSNTAQVASPAGTTDSNLANNSATDVETTDVIFIDGFGP